MQDGTCHENLLQSGLWIVFEAIIIVRGLIWNSISSKHTHHLKKYI